MRNLIAALLLLLLPQQQPVKVEDAEASLKKLTTVYSILEQEYADPISPEKQIFQGAIPGMLQRLDPYSVFFDADQFHTLQQHQEAKSEGFGTIVTVMPGRVVVLQAFDGSPAARAGIGPGDELLEVNGYRIDRLDVDQIIELLTAARSQPRTEMMVLRPNSNRVERITASPAELSETSVDRAFFLRKGVGYLHVTSFEQNTAVETKEAMQKLGEMRGLVLDFRDNRGGAVNSAIDMCGLFLPKGTKVLTARGRSAEEKTFSVENSDPIGQNVSLVLLVGNKTASAAEIVAGALQDNKRARLVGQTTYGKGTVQSVYPLRDGTGLALATARYVTPSGRFIERTRTANGGIPPDVEVAPFAYTEFQAFLENISAFLEYARKVKGEGATFQPGFEVTPQMVDDFRAFLSEHSFPINEKTWSENRNYIRTRLKTELSNLMFGVAQGDEVAAAADPQVQRAVQLLTAP